MQESKREEIALFRYGIILPFLSQDELEWGMKGEMRRRIAQQHYDIPHSGKQTISEETVRKWLASYRAKGFDGLKPKSRNDAGKPRRIAPEAWEKAVALKKEAPKRSVRKIIQIMEVCGLIHPGEIKNSTLAQHFKTHGLDRNSLKENQQVFRKFEAERPNQIWQSDILYGPYLPDPNQPQKNKRTYLVAFIDDFSRLAPHAEFYWDEKAPTVENTLKKAMLKRGMPEIIYVDNGKVYSARRLDAACAALGIRKIHCKPYSPEGKGKVERFFRTVRDGFLEEPEITRTQTLPELNKLFWAWLEIDYHTREHGSTGMPPLDRWRQHIGNYLRTVDEKELFELFLQQVSRKVDKVGLISVRGIDFEVDAILKNKKVEARYNPFDLSHVKIYYKEHFYQIARPAKITRWNTASKSKPPAKNDNPDTGIKPLQKMAEQHRHHQQQKAGELIGSKPTAKRGANHLNLPEFIHAIATALGKKADTFHAREVDTLKAFFDTHQPLDAGWVAVAMATAILNHGKQQHIEVYLQAIKMQIRKANK
ncbi:MAG: DDE-type integrase/transposase/recombinase [bacterium]